MASVMLQIGLFILSPNIAAVVALKNPPFAFVGRQRFAFVGKQRSHLGH